MQKRIARSSTRAELLALEECVDFLIYIKSFLTKIWKHVSLEVLCDSADVLHLLQQIHCKPSEKALVKHIIALHTRVIVVPLYALSEQVEDEKIILSKVHTSLNVADYLSKPRDVKFLTKLLQTNFTVTARNIPVTARNTSDNSYRHIAKPNYNLRDRATLKSPDRLNL